MRGALGRGKEVLLKRQHERNLQKHLDRIRQMRPNSTGWEWTSGQPTLNQQKKNRMLEDKITEIQRENRHLLEKITQTINKRPSKDNDVERMNRSLNYSFRKKQTESIDIQNSKLLKRLQDKKSKYQAWKLKQQWKKQKEVIKNIALFPFIIRDGSRRPRRKTLSKEMQHNLATQRKKMKDLTQLTRIRKINQVNLIITLKMDEAKLSIFGKDQTSNYLKVVEIPKEEAIQFIQRQCDGKLENILDHLHYNPNQQILQLSPKHHRKTSKIDKQIIKKQTKLLIDDLQSF